MTRSGNLVAALAATGALLLGACSTSSTPGPAKTVTVTRARPSTTAAATTAVSTSAQPSTTAPPVLTKLPGTCDTLLPVPAIDTALGRSVDGQVAFVVGKAEPDIARIGYLNCRYGLPSGAAARTATPAVEIGVSLYSTADNAAKRVPVTVDDYANHGAAQTNTTVDAVPATILTGGAGAGYTNPTLVAASGQVTMAITVVEKSAANASKDLTALARLVLQQLGA